MKNFLEEHKDGIWVALGAAILILSSMVVVVGIVHFFKAL